MARIPSVSARPSRPVGPASAFYARRAGGSKINSPFLVISRNPENYRTENVLREGHNEVKCGKLGTGRNSRGTGDLWEQWDVLRNRSTVTAHQLGNSRSGFVTCAANPVSPTSNSRQERALRDEYRAGGYHAAVGCPRCGSRRRSCGPAAETSGSGASTGRGSGASSTPTPTWRDRRVGHAALGRKACLSPARATAPAQAGPPDHDASLLPGRPMPARSPAAGRPP